MLKRWFKNRLETIKKHNDFQDNEDTVEECENNGHWTPCDLILREVLNNGGGSARGFLGITRSECLKCYDYILENKQELIDMNMISKSAWNNSGFPLWDNYNF